MSTEKLAGKIMKELEGRDVSKMSMQELGAMLSVVYIMRSYEQTEAYYTGAACKCLERG